MATNKPTNQMTTAEKRALQEELDAALVQAIGDVSKFAVLYEIEPSIRITNNKSRLGSAQASNGAGYDKQVRKRLGIEKWNKPPVFKISISTKECGTDEDLKNTLYHEVIHCAHNCFNHGKQFKALAAKVNAAYGTNVTTRKVVDTAAPSQDSKFNWGSLNAPIPPLPGEGQPTSLRSSLYSHIGESFTERSITYTFTGFNGNPKNCCDLSGSNGKQYKCSAETLANMFGVFGADDILEQRKQKAKKRLEDVELKIALQKRVGSSFKAGRKSYTFTGFNSNPKNCCDLTDERGIKYKCSLATLAHDFGLM